MFGNVIQKEKWPPQFLFGLLTMMIAKDKTPSEKSPNGRVWMTTKTDLSGLTEISSIQALWKESLFISMGNKSKSERTE